MSFIDYNFRSRGEVPSGLKDIRKDNTSPARVIDIIMDSDHPKYDDYDGHPRVYLEILGKETPCPYCGTIYILTDFDE